jgi:hypothetical protein
MVGLPWLLESVFTTLPICQGSRPSNQPKMCETRTKRGLMCLNRADGKLLWHQEIEYPAKETGVSPPYYPCAASPATDGEGVVVSYGSAGMYCYGFAGKVLWKRDDLGKWNHTYGNASSPVLYGDLAILWCGPDAKHTRLLAVNKKTGKTVWEHKERHGSWSTPLVVKVDGQDQLHLSMPDGLKGFDPKTGNAMTRTCCRCCSRSSRPSGTNTLYAV